MTEVNKKLRELGLTYNQATIYLELAKVEKAKAGEIIKATGFHRNIIYNCLEELTKLSLIAVSKEDGVHVYKLTDPEKLIRDQEDRVEKSKKLVKYISKLKTIPEMQKIIVHEGQSEFLAHTRNTYQRIKSGDMVRLLGISPKFHDIMAEEIGERIQKVSNFKKIRSKILAKNLDKKDLEYIKSSQGYIEAKESELVANDTNSI